MKGIPAYSPLVKVAWGVFQRCVETTLAAVNHHLEFENMFAHLGMSQE